MTVSERMWAKIEVRGPDECWPWKGATSAEGYGRLKVGGKLLAPHRLVVEERDGPLGDGALVRHTCDDPGCCNPRHLLSGSQAENMRECVERGRHTPPRVYGERNGRARLTDTSAAAIRRDHATGRFSQRGLARRHGVARGTIRAVIEQRTWRPA